MSEYDCSCFDDLWASSTMTQVMDHDPEVRREAGIHIMAVLRFFTEEIPADDLFAAAPLILPLAGKAFLAGDPWSLPLLEALYDFTDRLTSCANLDPLAHERLWEIVDGIGAPKAA